MLYKCSQSSVEGDCCRRGRGGGDDTEWYSASATEAEMYVK